MRGLVLITFNEDHINEVEILTRVALFDCWQNLLTIDSHRFIREIKSGVLQDKVYIGPLILLFL